MKTKFKLKSHNRFNNGERVRCFGKRCRLEGDAALVPMDYEFSCSPDADYLLASKKQEATDRQRALLGMVSHRSE